MASSVAAAGAAVALYFYSRKVKLCGFGSRAEAEAPAGSISHFEGAYQAPSTWLEALYFFAEALRYMYNESLGRWRTADLLIGLAYLARQETEHGALADLACTGHLYGEERSAKERELALEEFRRIAHFMKFCQVLRERRAIAQTMLLARLGIAKEDILLQQGFAGMLKPSYVLVADHHVRCVVLAIRGTHSIKDMFTSLTSASKPHHMLSGSGVVLGYSHFGMLAAARWVLQQTQAALQEAMEQYPEYHLQIVGHSLGAGTAALLTTRLREIGGAFSEATCLAIACPACMTLELAKSCTGYVTTIINGHDMIPTLSPGAADALREEVMESSWYEAFRADMRSSAVVRAVEASIGGVGTVTSAASSWTASGFSAATQSLRACYQRRGTPALRRSGSDADQVAVMPSQRPELSATAGRVQVARDWALPEGGLESPSWASVLQLLEPLEADVQARRLEGRMASEEAVRASWPSTSWEGRWERAAADGNAEGQESVYKKAGQWWSKLRLRDCQPDCRGSAFRSRASADDVAAADSNFDSLAQPLPSTRMQMARKGSGQLPGNVLRPSISFREELLAAELDLNDPEIPLTPPPGGSSEAVHAAATSPRAAASPEQSQPTDAERQWRRMTYPAGRIYHLVPARLVLGADVHGLGTGSGQKEVDRISRSAIPVESSSSNSSSLEHSATHKALHEGVVGFETLLKEKDPYVVVQTKDSSLVEATGLAPPISPPEDYVLLEDVPQILQEVYARIRLCSRMLADHFVPSYLGSLESALKLAESGYPRRMQKQD